ncbi:MAG: SRPBCC family protein [Burkholderiaceae bacterium]|jgi:hypothetical protein
MLTAEYRFELPCTAERAFERLSDPLFDKVWQHACVDCRIDPADARQYFIEFNFLGKKMSFHCRIEEKTAPTRYCFKTLDGPFKYEGRYAIEALGDAADRRCTVLWTFQVEPGGFFGIVPAVILKKTLVSQYQKDVETLTRLLKEMPG